MEFDDEDRLKVNFNQRSGHKRIFGAGDATAGMYFVQSRRVFDSFTQSPNSLLNRCPVTTITLLIILVRLLLTTCWPWYIFFENPSNNLFRISLMLLFPSPTLNNTTIISTILDTPLIIVKCILKET